MAHCQTVDYRNANNHKQIGHLTDWQRLGAVTDKSEDGEQTHCEAHCKVHIVEQVHQQKYRRAEQHKCEVIVLALALAVVQKMYY